MHFQSVRISCQSGQMGLSSEFTSCRVGSCSQAAPQVMTLPGLRLIGIQRTRPIHVASGFCFCEYSVSSANVAMPCRTACPYLVKIVKPEPWVSTSQEVNKKFAWRWSRANCIRSNFIPICGYQSSLARPPPLHLIDFFPKLFNASRLVCRDHDSLKSHRSLVVRNN